MEHIVEIVARQLRKKAKYEVVILYIYLRQFCAQLAKLKEPTETLLVRLGDETCFSRSLRTL